MAHRTRARISRLLHHVPERLVFVPRPQSILSREPSQPSRFSAAVSAELPTCGEVRGIMRTIEDVLNSLRAEYLGMPGLRLTSEQAQRLCGIERTMCQLVLDALVDAKFLCVKPDGAYARLTDEETPRPHAAKASLRPEPRVVKAS
jgi:hypothetical protein